MKLDKFEFGLTKDHDPVKRYSIENNQGLSIAVINWGATLISVKVPDKAGHIEEITLGFEKFSDYEAHSPYFGSTVGRVANRIAGGTFLIGDKRYQLEKNEKGINHLHGGIRGFSKVIWEMETEHSDKAGTIKCTYKSVDGEEGYPGNFDVSVSYTLNQRNELIMEYHATCDKVCPVNLTNHAYWNLTGNKRNSVLTHQMNLRCGSYLPVDKELIPTGEVRKVENTPFDFRKTKSIVQDLEKAGGYDHCYLIDGEKGKCKAFALIYDPESRREMTVATTKPGVQLYTGNSLNGNQDQGFKSYDGFCLETQYYPDSVNQDSFPSILLKPGEEYSHKTIHTFRVN